MNNIQTLSEASAYYFHVNGAGHCPAGCGCEVLGNSVLNNYLNYPRHRRLYDHDLSQMLPNFVSKNPLLSPNEHVINTRQHPTWYPL